MESWFIFILATLIISALINFVHPSNKNHRSYKLPPGPSNFPIISSFLLTRKSLPELERLIQSLRNKFGPIITLHIGSRPAIFVSDSSLAYQALIQNGAVFSDRPPANAVSKISKQLNINSAAFGPTWRLLRRNLASQILHPSRVKSHAFARKWVLQILFDGLKCHSEVRIVDHFQFAMFRLLVVMCFGEKLDEKKIREVHDVQYLMLLNLKRFSVFNFWPSVTKFVFFKLWREFMEIRQKQESVLIPLIRDRMKEMKELKDDNYTALAYVDTAETASLSSQYQKSRALSHPLAYVDIAETSSLSSQYQKSHALSHPLAYDDIAETSSLSSHYRKSRALRHPLAYVDTLFDLQLPAEEEKRKLQENEIMSLCSEFLTAGTDTTSTALQWVMANLVKYPDIQDKVFKEIKGVVVFGDGEIIREVTEDDLEKLPYLKAVILESLRLHPPLHFVVPHAVTEDKVFDGFLFPKKASINFMVAEMGLDSKVWCDPTSFKPERFLNGGGGEGEGEEVFDVTGRGGIKMMPFGAGRRICPGLGLAMLHLEYFVSNLIWFYEWKAVDGDEVDLEEKLEFTMVMKTPLKAHIYPRSK